jgi:hypothetical protein
MYHSINPGDYTMVIQNSLRILNEITEIEELIDKVENLIKINKLDIDVDVLLKEIISKSER